VKSERTSGFLAAVRRHEPVATELPYGAPMDAGDQDLESGSAPESVAVDTARRAQRLKLGLIAGDAIAILLAAELAFVMPGEKYGHSVSFAILAGLASMIGGIVAMRQQELYLARVNTVRTAEINGTIRAMAVLAALWLFVDRLLQTGIYLRDVLLTAIFAVVLISASRSLFRTWLSTHRKAGNYQRNVLVIGTDAEARRLVDLFDCHRELGVNVVGCVGSQTTALANGLARFWQGPTADAVEVARTQRAVGVVMSAGVMGGQASNDLIRDLQEAGLHIHIATGIVGMHSRRVRTLPLAYEPMLYLEAPNLSTTQAAAKRVFDMTLSAIGIIVLSPLLLAIAAIIKTSDPGPVFFKQERVGRNGRHFHVYKFRTMVVDAEAQLAKLQAMNERKGPLFKMENDPRVTRIGRFLRSSSLDELPQLLNVVRGEMSLVGPRPALPKEVEEFPESLRAREQVQPGITGLWQVEARDNPSFDAYRRLDLFYVENWSITLDLLIIIGTVEQLLAKVLFRRVRAAEPTPLATAQVA
jgi:exopolysaccharide biosynthesis polyprenyl glycosylphosphotransferase